jgi:hypothetical protein
VRPAAAARWKAFAAITLEATRSAVAASAIDLRLRSGDERRQAINADVVWHRRLRLRLRRLKLRLRTVVPIVIVLARLVMLVTVARRVGLALAMMVVARHERLRLRRNETRLLPEI